MRTMLTAIVLTLLFAATAAADSASHRAAANELLVASNSAQMVEQMRGQIRQTFADAMGQLEIKDADKAKMDRFTRRMGDIIAQTVSWDAMKDQFVEIYVKVYSEQEIRELTAFYRSPIGRKLMAKMPELLQASMEIGQQQMLKVLPQLEELTRELEQELTPPAKAAGPAK